MSDTAIIHESIVNWDMLNEQAMLNKIKDVSYEQFEHISKIHKKNVSGFIAYLKKNGVDVQGVITDGKKIAAKYKPAFKSESGSQAKIGKGITDDVWTVVNKHKAKAEGEDIGKGVMYGIGGVIALLLIQTILMIYLGVILTPLVGAGAISIAGAGAIATVITSVIVAPITEEYLKKIAVQAGVPYTATMTFAGAEALLYIFGPMGQAIGVGKMAIQRILPFFMHIYTTAVQKKHYEESGKTEEGSMKGYKMGVILHAIWNFMAVLKNL